MEEKIGETEYGIGWIPFGGYVKIAGMIDESMDKEQLKQPPQPYEFRSKPAWQRLIIMVAGVVVNLLLGFFIYAMILWHWGEPYIPTNKTTYGIAVDSLSESIGLRDGDKILSVDGKYIDKFNKIYKKVILNNAQNLQVDRNGQQLNIPIPGDFASKLIHYKDVNFMDVRMPFIAIDTIIGDTSVAARAGLQKGDKVLAVNSVNVPFFQDFKKELHKRKGKPANLLIQRGADTSLITLKVPPTGIIGVGTTTATDSIFEVKKIDYSFFEAFPASFNKSIETLQDYWLQLKLLVSGKVNLNESLGSVISIGKMFSPTWDWQSFWGLTAIFSLILALMNILPIPALDGGHALFTIYEIITRRKPGEKFIEYAQMAGMVLLLGLMAYALGLDFLRMFK